MSSPLGNTTPNFLQKGLIKLHKKASHSHRVKILSEIIYTDFLAPLSKDYQNLKVLDTGCGDMQIMHLLKNKLPGHIFKGMDVFQLPAHLASESYWEDYVVFDGVNIPFENNYFDVVLLVDVLHHIKAENQLPLLSEIKRVAKMVIIKDHFETNFLSRQMLRLMDLVGNWAYGVNIPKKYFTVESFGRLLASAGYKETGMIKAIDLYGHLKPLSFIVKDKWQFIYFGKIH